MFLASLLEAMKQLVLQHWDFLANFTIRSSAKGSDGRLFGLALWVWASLLVRASNSMHFQDRRLL